MKESKTIIFKIKEYIDGDLDSIYFMKVTPSEGDPYINYLNYEIHYEEIKKQKKIETIKIFRPKIPDYSIPEIPLEPYIPEEILESYPEKKFSSSFDIFIFTKIE